MTSAARLPRRQNGVLSDVSPRAPTPARRKLSMRSSAAIRWVEKPLDAAAARADQHVSAAIGPVEAEKRGACGIEQRRAAVEVLAAAMRTAHRLIGDAEAL